MTIIVELTIPVEHFALAETRSRVPDVTVKVDNVVAHDAEQITPCFWAFGDERATSEQAARLIGVTFGLKKSLTTTFECLLLVPSARNEAV